LGSAPKEWLLTYLDELQATPFLREGIPDIVAHMHATLDEAAPWLNGADVEMVKRRQETL
jgi:hypothetical protein